MRLGPLIALLAASCADSSGPGPGNQPAGVAAGDKPAAAVQAFSHDEKNELVDFHFGWSAEAAGVPQLAERFRKAMLAARAELVAQAEEDRAMRQKQGFDFHGFMSTTDYKTAGQSPQLLSLSVEFGSYTGGAHGNYGVGALLWDRPKQQEIKAAQLFAAPGDMDRLLARRWCEALDKAREEKRGEPVGDGGLFDECPGLDEIALIPGDKDGNGRFDTLALVASPYVAGPWAEGAYEVELAVTPELLAALKGEYRTGFEAGQTQ